MADEVFDGATSLAEDTASKAAGAARRGAEAGLKMHRQAAAAGKDIAKTSHEAFDEMAALWRNSYRPLASLQGDVNRMVDDIWRHMTGVALGSAMRPANLFAAGGLTSFIGAPSADYKELQDGYALRLEVPGLEPEDLQLSVRGDMLTVCGQKLESRDDGVGGYRMSERRYGRFDRTFPLPPDVEQDGIEAELKNGVLDIRLPRMPNQLVPHREIEIRR